MKRIIFEAAENCSHMFDEIDVLTDGEVDVFGVDYYGVCVPDEADTEACRTELAALLAGFGFYEGQHYSWVELIHVDVK